MFNVINGFNKYSSKSGDFAFGLNIGAGYAINEQLLVNINYNYGFSEADDLEELKIKNRVVRLGLSYSFN